MAAVTFAGFFIIKKYVPGLTNIDLTENVENNLNENLSNSEDMGQDEFSQEEQLYDEMGNGEFESSADNVSIKTKGNQPAVKNEQKRAAGEGEIMVEGVPIKNEPKLMAEAIQHLMSKDE
ncbi:MAG: hypothetical protein OEZ13_05680 [Spirochaetia bacterium]|nr:hypothetical protein [Spirochaetia bacterium]